MDTEFYQGIEKGIKKYLKKLGGGAENQEEAEDLAWDDRRFGLKHFLKKHENELDDKLFNQDEEDDEDDE